MDNQEPKPSSPLDSAITGQRPLPADTGITGERPVPGAGNNTLESLRSLAFLGRLKVVLQIYADIRRRPNPPMWGLMQAGFLVLGIAIGYSLIQPTFEATGDDRWGGLVFLAVFLGFAVVPDLLLKLIRRSQLAVVRQRLEETARLTLRTYPEEIEQCGGMRILTDPVELEALVHVLENTYHPPPQPDKERWWTNK